MGIRYLKVVPKESALAPGGRSASWLDLEATEAHDPPAYLARLRVFADREPALDLEHVRDVAGPVLARLGCRDPGEYVARALLLARARARIAELAATRPASDEAAGLRYERALEVAGALDRRERVVYRVHEAGEHALTFWLPEGPGTPELFWVSRRFRADERLRPRAVEHGFTYVAWALGELAAVRARLLADPHPLVLGWGTLPTT